MPNSFALGRFDNGGVDAIITVGTTQAGAPLLTGAVNVLTTAAGQVGALLPVNGTFGSPIVVRVNTATAATIFPPVGGSINGGAVNAAFSVAQNKPAVFYAHPNGLDYTVVLSA